MSALIQFIEFARNGSGAGRLSILFRGLVTQASLPVVWGRLDTGRDAWVTKANLVAAPPRWEKRSSFWFHRASSLVKTAFLSAVITGAGCLFPTVSVSDVVLVEEGRARAAIQVAPEVMAPDQGELDEFTISVAMQPEPQRRRLRESVNDLALCLEKMSGAKVPIITDASAKPAESVVPIYIGAKAAEVFGEVGKSYPFKQAFRVVISRKAIGLFGESDLATSYAIYELLDRLGCRWFMPSDMGEVIPSMKTIALKAMDFRSAPSTLYRGHGYLDDAYRRRNRHGGLYLASGDALETYITPEQRKAHPEWRATVDGKPQEIRLKWSNPVVADAIAEAILASKATHPNPTVSISPCDGLGFDNSPEDKALDAGDWDEASGEVSITDRLLAFVNPIVKRVNAKYPDLRFGLLSYANYLRPPVREKPDPHIVPHLAPITYSRAHPMDDDRVPGNKELRYAIEGWAKIRPEMAYWFYAWFLAEPVAPNPMLTKWGHDVPYVLEKGNCQFWQPETNANFDTSMHALYLGCRLAFNSKLKPADVFREINEKFYGNAAREMTAYWEYIDHVWVDINEYSGCGFGHLRRWTPEKLKGARQLLNKAVAAAQTDQEKFRIGLAHDSLQLFEAFMKLRCDQAEGRFEGLAQDAEAWHARVKVLVEKYKPQFAFTFMPYGAGRILSDEYFAWFYEPTYKDATRLAKEFQILTPKPLRQFRWIQDPEKQGEAAGYAKPDFDDGAWKTTDVCVETWSTLGLHNYFKSVWYRTKVAIPAAPAGKRVWLWLANTDGSAKVFVNGKHIPYVMETRDKDGKSVSETKPESSGYCTPFSFDITSAVKPGAENQISLLCTRAALNELGTGGLLGPVTVYRESDTRDKK
ncbi:MAG: DUF4838 domain-containing protein [Verrucomicrobia bacterium]|nr:DUF4838 domain-containing protein [Verrucomicrobiota bacterium]